MLVSKTTGPPRIDFSLLEKGNLIPCELLEYLFGSQRESDRYRLSVMALCDSIRRERDDLKAHVKTTRGAIKIMNDEEGEEHTWLCAHKAVRSIAVNTARRASLDYSQLPADSVKIAESRDLALTGLAVAGQKHLALARRSAILRG